jgi:hypothetical protein
MFPRRREEVMPKPRPGISIKKVMIGMFFTARWLIALDVLSKGQKYNQDYFVQSMLSSLLNEKKHFSRQKIAIDFLYTWMIRYAK